MVEIGFSFVVVYWLVVFVWCYVLFWLEVVELVVCYVFVVLGVFVVGVVGGFVLLYFVGGCLDWFELVVVYVWECLLVGGV